MTWDDFGFFHFIYLTSMKISGSRKPSRLVLFHSWWWRQFAELFWCSSISYGGFSRRLRNDLKQLEFCVLDSRTWIYKQNQSIDTENLKSELKSVNAELSRLHYRLDKRKEKTQEKKEKRRTRMRSSKRALRRRHWRSMNRFLFIIDKEIFRTIFIYVILRVTIAKLRNYLIYLSIAYFL